MSERQRFFAGSQRRPSVPGVDTSASSAATATEGGIGGIALAALIIGFIAFTFGLTAFILTFTHKHDGKNELDGQYCADCCLEHERLESFEFGSVGTDGVCFEPENPECEFSLFPFSPVSYAGDASEISLGDGELCVASFPFTSTFPASGNGPDLFGALDHVKFLAYMGENNSFEGYPTQKEGACDATELVYEGNITCQVDLNWDNAPLAYSSGVEFPEEDYRLATCGFNTIAFQQHNNGVGKGAWVVADFFLTNERIFAFSERLPFGKPSFGGNLNEYNAYTSAIPVARRTPGEYHKLAIAFNKAKGTIRWLIDDIEVHREIRIGFAPELCESAILHGGDNEAAFPDNVSFGFGTFTILDAFPWNWGQCNENRPLARLSPGNSSYFNPFDRDTYGQPLPVDNFYTDTPAYEDRLWGQGAGMCIDYLRVSYKECGCAQ